MLLFKFEYRVHFCECENAQYTNATFYFDRLFPVFARYCPCRMWHIFFPVFPDFGETFCTCERVCVWVYIASFTTVAILWFSRIFLHACLSTFYYFANCWRAKWVSYLVLPRHFFYSLFRIDGTHIAQALLIL